MEREELIDKFIQGTLTKDEEIEFNTLHNDDPTCREEVTFLKDITVVTGLEDRNQLRQSLAIFESKIDTTAPKNILILLQKKWLILASILLIVLIGGITMFNPFAVNTTKLYIDNFEAYKNVVTPIIRGESNESEEITAFTLYESKKYAEAADTFNTLYNNTQKPYLLLYQANALLSIDQSKNAIPLLEKHIEFNDQLSERSRWYLALAYLKEKRTEEAIFLLKEITRRGVFKQGSAKNLLHKLE